MKGASIRWRRGSFHRGSLSLGYPSEEPVEGPFPLCWQDCGAEQNVCRDLKITSNFPSLMSARSRMPFSHRHPPRSAGFQSAEKPGASAGHLLAPHLVDGVSSLWPPCPAGMAGLGNTTARQLPRLSLNLLPQPNIHPFLREEE